MKLSKMLRRQAKGSAMKVVLWIRMFVMFLMLITSMVMGENSPENVWIVSDLVLSHGSEDAFDEIAVKDPSIVFFEGKWHLFFTARNRQEYTTGYVSTKNLTDFLSEPKHELEMIGGKSRYGCAPQIFYFEPQGTWYLVFQTRDSNYQPSFSTTKTISKPCSWSTPENLLKKDTASKWIDFWIICDKTKACLFYTQSHSGIYVRTTSLTDFPGGWSEGRKVFSDVHEAAHIYKVKGRSEYHMIYELNIQGIRSFGLASAENLTGPWEKVTDRYATGGQLTYRDSQLKWTEMVSHGEALRTGYNQLMEYDPKGCTWIIQGLMRKDSDVSYPSLPWQLGTISKFESGKGNAPAGSDKKP